MPNIGPMELAIVAVIALLILGPKRLPSAGRSLGHGLREFKDAISGRSGAALDAADDQPTVTRSDARVTPEAAG